MDVYLYNGGRTEALDLCEIARYIKNSIKDTKVEIREEFLTHALAGVSLKEKERLVNTLALKLAKAKVRDLKSRKMDWEPLYGEIEYEKKRILNPEQKSFGILYDGFELQKMCSSLIPKHEENFKSAHIIFTNQLIGTFDYDDQRYHARVSFCSVPSFLSATGVIEAPAKPREYYLRKQLGVDYITLKKEFKGRFIDYDDPNITQVLKGYVIQALVFHLTGEPFCEDSNCRLYNAHWQEEVIRAQLESEYEFCERHAKLLKHFS